MVRYDMFSRRRFLQGTMALAVTRPWRVLAADAASASLAGRLYKTLKIGMVDVPGSLTDKFQAVKAAGFLGVEMDSPGMDVAETRRAIAASGLPVDGTVCSTHWSIRHTSPDAAQALRHWRISRRHCAIRTRSVATPCCSSWDTDRTAPCRTSGRARSRTSRKPCRSRRNWVCALPSRMFGTISFMNMMDRPTRRRTSSPSTSTNSIRPGSACSMTSAITGSTAIRRNGFARSANAS